MNLTIKNCYCLQGFFPSDGVYDDKIFEFMKHVLFEPALLLLNSILMNGSPDCHKKPAHCRLHSVVGHEIVRLITKCGLRISCTKRIETFCPTLYKLAMEGYKKINMFKMKVNLSKENDSNIPVFILVVALLLEKKAIELLSGKWCQLDKGGGFNPAEFEMIRAEHKTNNQKTCWKNLFSLRFSCEIYPMKKRMKIDKDVNDDSNECTGTLIGWTIQEMVYILAFGYPYPFEPLGDGEAIPEEAKCKEFYARVELELNTFFRKFPSKNDAVEFAMRRRQFEDKNSVENKPAHGFLPQSDMRNWREITKSTDAIIKKLKHMQELHVLRAVNTGVTIQLLENHGKRYFEDKEIYGTTPKGKGSQPYGFALLTKPKGTKGKDKDKDKEGANDFPVVLKQIGKDISQVMDQQIKRLQPTLSTGGADLEKIWNNVCKLRELPTDDTGIAPNEKKRKREEEDLGMTKEEPTEDNLFDEPIPRKEDNEPDPGKP